MEPIKNVIALLENKILTAGLLADAYTKVRSACIIFPQIQEYQSMKHFKLNKPKYKSFAELLASLYSRQICLTDLVKPTILAFILILPILAGYYVDPPANVSILSILMLTAGSMIVCTLGVYALFALSRYSTIIVLPAVMLSLTQGLYMLITGFDVGYHTISAVFDTNLKEAIELVKSPMIWPGMIGLVAILVGLIFLLRWKGAYKLLRNPIRIHSGYAALAAIIATICLTGWRAQGNEFSDVYPGKLVSQTIQYFEEVIAIRKEWKKVHYTYKGTPIDDKPQTLVLVIGESARSFNFQIYGYDRNTTPKMANFLAQHPDTSTFYPKATASGRVTRTVVPLLMSVRSAKEFGDFYKYPSFLKVFNAAGYKTFLVSGQPASGYYEGLPNMVLGDAHVKNHLTEQGNFNPKDKELLPKFKEYLADPAPKKLIILHMQGSHANYTDRYPKEFNRFKGRGVMFDTYDNSVLYTDDFLHEVFSLVKNRTEPAMVFFASDHGENLNDNNNGNFSHGAAEVTKYELNIPMLGYFNSAFNKRYPTKVANFMHNRDKRITHDVISHMYMGLADFNADDVYLKNYDITGSCYNPGKFYLADNMKTIYPLSKFKNLLLPNVPRKFVKNPKAKHVSKAK